MKPVIRKGVVLQISALLLSLSLAAGCGLRTDFDEFSGPVTVTEAMENDSFAAFTEELFRDEVVGNIINLHYTLSDPGAYGIDTYEVALGDLSEDARNASKKALKKTRRALKKFKKSELSLSQQLTYDVLLDYLDTQLALSEYELYQEVLMPSNGMQSQLPILFAEYAFDSVSDVEDYLEMLSLTDSYFESILEFEKEKAKEGLFMSDEACNAIIDECQGFISGNQCSYLIDAFGERLDQVPGLSPAQREDYIRENEAVIANHVIPAYESLIESLTYLMGSGTNDLGLANYPEGAAYYELLVYADTGYDCSMEDLYQTVAAQRSRDLRTCSDLVRENTSLPTECASISWPQEDPLAMIANLQSAMKEDFPAAPDSRYEVNYVVESLQDSLAPAFYLTAPIDNYLQNVIYINPAANYQGLTLFTTLAHEGYPGHLYQTIMTYDSGIPAIRTLLDYPGYIEGWATYVEMLSYYYAGLSQQQASYLQHYQSAILSLYASCDIGIHYYGWNQEEIAAFWESYGINDAGTIADLTDLICNDPGNYLKYYVGYYGFLELKAKMQEAYPDTFSLPDFHQAVLSMGPAPFSILSEYFDSYFNNH